MGDLFNNAKNWLLEKDAQIFGWFADKLPMQAMGPVGAVAKVTRDVNTMTKQIFGNSAPGITLPGTVFDKFIQVPDIEQTYFTFGGTRGADTNMFDDTVLGEIEVKASPLSAMTSTTSTSFELPFWAKVGIVGAILVGTALVVKGSMEK
jgi:hypothetical protein